ncbi:extracellular solute-binding protein [Paenibacillus agaridevorans]|uniref:extracellular solute-binding protein n=1 Tax=Paenibacillus agaridevorans TaxID=171404 RepID=UPI001BE3E5B6|nr:extracellular solute-binding protein [Paenibacillus agaridevorans]
MGANVKSGRDQFRSRLRYMIEDLKNDILNGTYKPNDFLPSESDLVQRYGLSNKSVRKGLDELVADGWIVKINRVGSKVTEKGQESNVITLGISSSIEQDIVLSKLLGDFNVLYPHLQVKTLTITNTNYISQIKNYLEHGLVDIFTLNSLHFQELEENGGISLLEPLESDQEAYPFLNKVFQHQSNQYANPIVFSPIVLVYNRAHFAEENVPEPDGSWTWEDTLKYSEILSRVNGRLGIYFIMVSSLRWPVFLFQSGEEFKLDENGQYDITDSQLLESIKLCKRIIKKQSNYLGFLVENNMDVMDLFRQGKVSMMMASYMALNELKDTDLDFDVSPTPFIHTPSTMLHTIGVSLRKLDHDNKAARLLVDYLKSARANNIIHKWSNSIPAIRFLGETHTEEPNLINRPFRYHLYREIITTYQSNSRLNLSAQNFEKLGRLLKKYWSDLISEDELCQMVKEGLYER